MWSPYLNRFEKEYLLLSLLTRAVIASPLLIAINQVNVTSKEVLGLRIAGVLIVFIIFCWCFVDCYLWQEYRLEERDQWKKSGRQWIAKEAIATEVNYNHQTIYSNGDLLGNDVSYPSVDLIGLIAKYDGHIMFSSRTGSGKTTIVLAAIAEIYNNNPDSEWYVIDPKHSGWLGLEYQEKVVYPQMDQPDTVQEGIDLLSRLTAILRQRQQTRNNAIQTNQKYNPNPIRLIIDEWLTLVAIADSVGLKKELVSLVQNIFYTGREDKVFIWISGQTHAAKENGFSTGVRDNLGIVALGRNGNYASIEKALNDAYLIPSKATRNKLFNKFENLSNSNTGITYTNLSNHDLIETPVLDSDNIKRITLFNTVRETRQPENIITIDVPSVGVASDMPLNANSCPKCYSENTVKHGGDRRRCKDCGKTFSKKK